ncbi:MAG: hypothetical protein AAFR55_06580, partial [Pseudomonadota bacterium]
LIGVAIGAGLMAAGRAVGRAVFAIAPRRELSFAQLACALAMIMAAKQSIARINAIRVVLLVPTLLAS